MRHTCARLGRDSFLQIGKCFGSRACSGNGEERETPSKQARRVQDVDILPPNVAGYQILYRSTVPAPPVSALPSSWWRSALPTGGEQTGFGLGRVSCASARLRHLHLLEPFKAAKQLSAGTLSAGLSFGTFIYSLHFDDAGALWLPVAKTSGAPTLTQIELPVAIFEQIKPLLKSLEEEQSFDLGNSLPASKGIIIGNECLVTPMATKTQSLS